MSKPIKPNEADEISSKIPDDKPTFFVHTMTVAWSDCDPALIVYTGRIPYFALEAIEVWWKKITGFDWYTLNIDRNIGTPFVHMSLDFKSPVTPRQDLRCVVELMSIGNRSITHRVCGWQGDALCFEGLFVSVFVVAKSFEARLPPKDLLDAIKPFLAKS